MLRQFAATSIEQGDAVGDKSLSVDKVRSAAGKSDTASGESSGNSEDLARIVSQFKLDRGQNTAPAQSDTKARRLGPAYKPKLPLAPAPG